MTLSAFRDDKTSPSNSFLLEARERLQALRMDSAGLFGALTGLCERIDPASDGRGESAGLRVCTEAAAGLLALLNVGTRARDDEGMGEREWSSLVGLGANIDGGRLGPGSRTAAGVLARSRRSGPAPGKGGG